MVARAPIVLALLAVVGCTATHDPLDAGAMEAGPIDAAPTDGNARDAGMPDSPVRADTGPRPDADLLVHSRCATPRATRALVTTLGGACRLDDGGQLWCWGENNWGQVRPGAGTWVEPHEVAYEGLSDVVGVADSGLHRCVMHRDGGVSCWGGNASGECGVAMPHSVTAPVRVAGIEGADRIVVAPGISCARVAEARWMCWGGAGYVAEAFGVSATPTTTPFELPGLEGAEVLSIGYNAAALFPDGHVEAISVPESRHARAYSLGFDDVIDAVAFEYYVCVVRRNGHVACAGSESVMDDPPAREVPGITDARALVRGGGLFYEACAITATGGLTCWTLARDPSPSPVPTAVDVDLAAMGSQICVTTCSGDVLCNALGWRGENGDDHTRVPPAEVIGLTDAVAIDGDCALRSDGTVACWDASRFTSYDDACGAPPLPLEPYPTLDHVVRLEDGAAIRDDGTVFCLGSASSALTGMPSPAIDALCSAGTAFAITSDGRLFDWLDSIATPGTFHIGELTTPAPVAELTGRAFRTTDGRVFDISCQSFFGEVCTVGDAWPGIGDASAVWTSAGALDGLTWGPSVECVRHVDGHIDCRFGGDAVTALAPRLGLGTVTAGAFVHVPLLDGAAELALDGNVVCARSLAGSVECWGDPGGGRLGANDVTVTHTMPATRATDLAMGRSLCARRADGHVVCWGLTSGAWSSGAVCPRPLDRRVLMP